MSFQKTHSLFHHTPKPHSKQQFIFSTVDEQRILEDQEATIAIQQRQIQEEECKFCEVKQKLVKGAKSYCLTHSIKRATQQIKDHLNDYLPTVRQLTISSFKSPVSIEELSMVSLIKQVEDLYNKICRVKMCIDTKTSPMQNEIILKLNKCIELLRKECIQFNDVDNDASYSISLQLDASNDVSQWLNSEIQQSYPHLEQQGLLPQTLQYLESIQDNKKKTSMFLALIDSFESKLEQNHSTQQEYQTTLKELNKKLLNYIEKVPANNSFKELEDDLNFIEHISALGEGISKNIQNTSSLTVKRKSFDGNEMENDLWKFTLLQAIALEKILPQANVENYSNFN